MDPGKLNYHPTVTAILYRAAAILLLLFAALHTFGFQQVDPQWRVDSVVSSMRSVHFDLIGTSRSYWELFVGFGLLFSVFLVFIAILAWQMSRLPPQMLTQMRGTAWALVICFAAVTIVNLRYAFLFPIGFSVLVLLCLAGAAWTARPRSR